MAKDTFEVQEYTICDGWINNWSEEVPSKLAGGYVTEAQTFETHDEAMAAIYEFFADLSRAHMVHGYSLDDYRVRRIL